ncbi:MAG: 4'-phosphopantetheinyl transferase superfamily protein [Candidatus Promineifilaceae bacterium]
MTKIIEQWLDPPEKVVLEAGDLHVWRVWLDQQSAVYLAQLREILSPDERERAARFHFPQHRERYIVARGTLRLLLGRYLGRSPESVAFTYGPQGKPALGEGTAQETLAFNVAHSEDVALLAFIWGRPVGVDIEHIRPLKDMAQLAARFFSVEEYQVWQAVSADSQDEAFFNCWSRKEAYIKALGEGLSHPLDRFVVTLRPGEVGRLVTVDGSAALAAKWQMQALHPMTGYASAVIVEGGWDRLKCWYFRSQVI